MFMRKFTRINILLRTIENYTCRYCSTKSSKTAWRTLWKKREGEWQSALSIFKTRAGPSSEYLSFIQTKIDLRPSSIKRWWRKTQEAIEVLNERFIPERHKILGNDLAAAHFIVYRKGAVRFYGQDTWIRQDENEEYDLPQVFNPDFCVEAIDGSNMRLHYDGLVNLIPLKRLRWLSFANCPFIDDWCLDRISGHFKDTLEYLDIRDCPNISSRGLGSLYRMTNLKKLLVSNPKADKNVELMCLMLEDILPNLEIKGIEYISIKEDGAKEKRIEIDLNKP